MQMSNKNSLFFKFNVLSNPPYLRIFGNYNYKTTWSAYVSILSIIFSFAFALYSSICYFKFPDPAIYYWKNSAYGKNLSIKLNETLLMFRIGDSYQHKTNKIDKIDLKAYLYEVNYNISYNDNIYNISLEECELGKNIDVKFKNLIKNFEENHFNESIKDYYCISKSDADKYFLSYDRNIGYNYLSLILHSKNESQAILQDLRLYLIIQNDIVNHTNKIEPININYAEAFSSNFDDEIFETSTFNLDYIEYESNDGIIFDSINSYYGIRLSSEPQELYFKKKSNVSTIGSIKIQINRNTYDRFKRNYIKIQYLLSEIESISCLIFYIGRIIANIIARKKMSIDLSRIIMSKKTEINKGDFDKYKSSPSFNEIFGDIEDMKNPKNKFKKYNSYAFNSLKSSFSSRDEIKTKSIFNKNILNKKIQINKDDNINNINNINNKNKQIIKDVLLKNQDNNLFNELKMKKINFLFFFKSYFYCCLKDKKTELINLCHDIILNELCIDRILIRLFKLEKIYYLLSDTDKAKIHYMQIQELEEINDYLKKKFSSDSVGREIIKSEDGIQTTNEEKEKN